MAGGADCMAFEMAGVHLLDAGLTEGSCASAERDLKMVLPIHLPGGVSVERAIRARTEGAGVRAHRVGASADRCRACIGLGCGMAT